MCGIIGYIGGKSAVEIVIEGLKNLEYRGYDSAGIALLKDGKIEVKRCKGKVRELTGLLEESDGRAHVAIGHTRWATHGKPSENNAHPHRSGPVVLVHNGIIENYLELKSSLESDGVKFSSETDTEVLCHLVARYHRTMGIEDAVLHAAREVQGSFAVAVFSERSPDRIVCARRDSPLVLGIGDREYFIASDVPAFLNHCRSVLYLENDEFAVLSEEGVEIRDADGSQVYREATVVDWTPSMAEKGGFKHFMLKEIFEQPRALADTLRGRFSVETAEVNLREFGLEREYIRAIRRIFVVACGTSWHAGLIGKYTIEELASVPVEVDIASEFRYRRPLISRDDLFVAISQSGETADTLAALREAKRLGARTLVICNVLGSSAARESDAVFYTHSGPEIGVASTKAFLTQIAALFLLAVALGRERGTLGEEEAGGLLTALKGIPGKVEAVLAQDETILNVARSVFKASDFLYLARGILYPVALEGALKLKEISYIHAEGYAAGEMKHGPIALVDESLPVVFLASQGILLDKMISNMNEIRSRGGRSIVVADGVTEVLGDVAESVITVPGTNKYLLPLVMTVPLQLLAYHVGVLRGCDVDQPRNLAKSVTVE